ncbi:hypothetical protein [Acinetobacter sp.]|uniref:hypothetical protein n=1 Tax=Acinetobacter sp. TaxID=472 RepID=UPI00388E1952
MEFKDAKTAWQYCHDKSKSGGYGYFAKPLEEEIKEKLSKEKALRAQLDEIEDLKKGIIR